MLDIYTPPEAAAEILNERQTNPVITTRVLEFLGGELPTGMPIGGAPRALLANYLARGTGEDIAFAEQAATAGLEPWWATYFSERYVSSNAEKVDTLRPPIQWAKGQRTRQWVVDPANRNGSIGQLTTVYGTPLRDYQANLRTVTFARNQLDAVRGNEFDVSDWYRLQAKRFGWQEGERLSPFYAIARTALVSCFAAYYRDYDAVDARFIREVLAPSIETVDKAIGLRPVIVKLAPTRPLRETDLSFLDREQAARLQRFGSLPVQSATLEGIND